MFKNAALLVIWILMLGSCPGVVLGGPIPSPLQGVGLLSKVHKDASTGILTYRYRVSNPATNEGQIRSIDIEITRATGDAALSREGLANGPRYMRNISEDAIQRVPMVPVGISGPNGWIAGLGFDDGSPARGYAGWGSTDEPFRILPDHSLEGFQLVSYGLPAIRKTKVEPGIDYDSLPDEYEDPDKAKDLADSLVFWTKTVGPKAPPEEFVPLEFLNYLIAILHDSRQQGWIKVDGVHQSLLAKLLAAKRSLEGGHNQAANGQLKAFLNEVQAVSCPEFTCPGNKPLTSEAYALLFFNGQYLVERLPAPGAR